jgi:hypothetical protein
VDVIVRGFEGGFLFGAVFALAIDELKVVVVSFGIIDLKKIVGGGVIYFFELFVDFEMLLIFV